MAKNKKAKIKKSKRAKDLVLNTSGIKYSRKKAQSTSLVVTSKNYRGGK